MNNQTMQRRSFILATVGLAAAGRAFPQGAKNDAPTAAQIIARIRDNVGIPWRTETVDRIVAGVPETRVTGIATTMMATFDVVRRAAAQGKNLVITHEPTFYMHQDQTDKLAEDATVQLKNDFIKTHNMVVFHFHDHWHAMKPDGIATGMTRELGWEKNTDPQDLRRFLFPGIPLAGFAKSIQSRLKIRTMRVLGDPHLSVRRVAASWGYVSQLPGIQLLARPDVDLLIAGEAREWEVVEYAQDAISAGKKKGLIVLGHVVSEQAGMKYCAEWLQKFIRDVPIAFVPAAEPFWMPDHPVG